MSSPTHGSVRDRVTDYQQRIDALHDERENMIAAEPPQFRLLPEKVSSLYGNQRYVLVYGDGSLPQYVYPLTQRPAALKATRRAGRYIWDTREDVVLDRDGEVIFRRGQQVSS